MASYALVDREPPVVVTNGATVQHRASGGLPKVLHFPIFLILSAFIRSTLWEMAVNVLGHELGTISREGDANQYFGVVLICRLLLHYYTWVAEYDWLDIGALTVLTNTPFAYLAVTYYGITSYTIAAHTAVEVIAVAVPTYLLRVRSPYHKKSAPVRNRFLLENTQVQLLTTALALGVYVVPFFVAQKKRWLNAFLMSHFDNIPSVENAHAEDFISLVMKLLPAAWAARAFLLNPSIGAQTASGVVTPDELFDPATATLPATLRKNFWFFSKRTRTLLRQTAVVVVFTMADSLMRILNMRDTDLVGTLGYSGFWGLITVVTAGWYAWVGNTEL